MDLPASTEQLMQAGWHQHAPRGFTGLIGPLWSRREHGDITFGLVAGENHLNPAGLVHGGALTTMLDQVLSTVAWEATERIPCVTIQLDTQFLAAVKSGAFVEARAEVMRKTRDLIFMRGELMVSTTRVATGSAVLKILRAVANG
jgi:uncharacterized protein (TIGR00369 family)